MVKKYDLKAMLLEIQEDEDSLQEGSQKPLSQGEIRRLAMEKRKARIKTAQKASGETHAE